MGAVDEFDEEAKKTVVPDQWSVLSGNKYLYNLVYLKGHVPAGA